LPECDPNDPPATTGDSEAESEPLGGLWLPALLGILCAVAVVASLFGVTLLVI
jgi:hypothetical protein